MQVTRHLDEERTQYSRAEYRYDGRGNRLEVHTGLDRDHAEGAVTRTTYGRFGNVLTFTDALGQTEHRAYDAVGRLAQKTDRGGNTTTYAYDPLDRLVEERVSAATPLATVVSTRGCTYTRTGQKAKETRGERLGEGPEELLETAYTYDEMGRLVTQADPGGITKRITYDPCGNRLSFVLEKEGAPQIQLWYTYDELNRLTSVCQSAAGGPLLAEYRYDAAGNRTHLGYPQTGVETRTTYNEANLVTALSSRRGYAKLAEFTYSYSPDGNQTGKTAGAEATTYTYDRLGRLVEEDSSKWSRIRYEYDRFGKRARLTVIPHGQQVEKPYETTYEYNLNNRLLKEVKRQAGATETFFYAYDKNGSQTRREWRREGPRRPTDLPAKVGFVTGEEQSGEVTLDLRCYNGFGQLIRADRDGRTIRYSYRPDGLRHGKTAQLAGKRQRKAAFYHWDGQSMVLESGGEAGTVKAAYLRGAGLIAQRIGGSLFYYLHNAHGDVVRRVNEGGAVNIRYDYDAFGNRRKAHNPAAKPTAGRDADPNPFRYCGEYWDGDLQEVYLRARTYQPTNGRFTAEDSARDGVNWYAYCAQSPVMATDPSGHYVANIDPFDDRRYPSYAAAAKAARKGSSSNYATNNPSISTDRNAPIDPAQFIDKFKAPSTAPALIPGAETWRGVYEGFKSFTQNTELPPFFVPITMLVRNLSLSGNRSGA